MLESAGKNRTPNSPVVHIYVLMHDDLDRIAGYVGGIIDKGTSMERMSEELVRWVSYRIEIEGEIGRNGELMCSYCLPRVVAEGAFIAFDAFAFLPVTAGDEASFGLLIGLVLYEYVWKMGNLHVSLSQAVYDVWTG